jgi:hypothetical protein
MSLPLVITADAVRIGDRFTIRFERTLRVPDDGRTYPLPPGLGRFEVHSVADYADRVPAHWRETGGIFISMYQSEALWLSFDAAPWKPSAVTIGVGRVNAVSGDAWPAPLVASPQNYLVCPPQLWLDGINAGSAYVRQFVAMPLGLGATVEGQITGVESHGGLQVRVHDPKPGRFPDTPPPGWGSAGAPPMAMGSIASSRAASPMGFAPGGRIQQKILTDEHGVETWDPAAHGTVIVHVLNSAQYRAVTARPAPASPVDARTYTEHGFPWFEIYEEQDDVPAAEALASLASLSAFSRIAGDDGVPDDSIDVSPTQVTRLGRRADRKPPKGAQ